MSEFYWLNPHGHIILQVAAAPGVDPAMVGEWDVECAATNIMARQGWTSTTLKAGEEITLVGNPLRDGDKEPRCSTSSSPMASGSIATSRGPKPGRRIERGCHDEIELDNRPAAAFAGISAIGIRAQAPGGAAAPAGANLAGYWWCRIRGQAAGRNGGTTAQGYGQGPSRSSPELNEEEMAFLRAGNVVNRAGRGQDPGCAPGNLAMSWASSGRATGYGGRLAKSSWVRNLFTRTAVRMSIRRALRDRHRQWRFHRPLGARHAPRGHDWVSIQDL